MRFVVLIVTILLLTGSVSAECREKACMNNESKFQEDGGKWHTFYFNDVFNIGTNWFIIFDYPSGKTNDTITFEFSSGFKKVHTYDPSKETDSISFSGSTFSEERFNLELYINITGTEGSDGEFILSIDINKPPAEDMFYLWGGMTIFWASIGAYVLYISIKFTQLRDK